MIDSAADSLGCTSVESGKLRHCDSVPCMPDEPGRKGVRSYRPKQYAKLMGRYPKTIYNWINKNQMPEGVTVISFPSGVYRLDVDHDIHPSFPNLDEGEDK